MPGINVPQIRYTPNTGYMPRIPAGGGEGGGGQADTGGTGFFNGVPDEMLQQFQRQQDRSVMGVSPGDKRFASKVRARIAREKWDDYKERFAPIERDLADYATGDAGLNEGLSMARESVDSAFDSSAGQLNRQMSRYGANPSGDVREARQRGLGLARAKARDSATNTVRRQTKNRRLGLMGGGLSADVRG